MSTLTYSRSHLADAASAASEARAQGFLAQALRGLMASQQRRADREIAAYIERHGGLLTDDMERQIMQRLAGAGRSSVTLTGQWMGGRDAAGQSVRPFGRGGAIRP